MNDFYDNKIAFIVALNFPYFSTEERTNSVQSGLRSNGDMPVWAMCSALAYLRNWFSRHPKVSADGDAYIADYNIYMGHLLNKDNQKLFRKIWFC